MERSSDDVAERSLLGAMMLSPKMISHVVDFVGASDYFIPKHAEVHRAIVDMWGAGRDIDAVTVAAELESRGELARVGGAPYLLSLIQETPFAPNAGAYAEAVRQRSRLRQLHQLGIRLQLLSTQEGHTADELIGEAQQFFTALDRPDGGAASFPDLIESWRDWEVGSASVIPTPWWPVNDWLHGGLARGRLVTIGGRPSAGKSLMGLNLAVNAAERGHSTLLFSLEMGRQEVAARILSAGGDVDMGQIMRRRLDLESSQRIDEYADSHKSMPLLVDDRERITVEQIAAKCRSIHSLELAVIDYLQLVSPSDRSLSREQQVSHMSRSLKILSRQLDIAVVCCAQLNRGPVRDGKPRDPTVADLRESGAVEQDSDVVLLLHRDMEDDVLKIICGKNRSGKTGTAELQFEGRYARLTSADDEATVQW